MPGACFISDPLGYLLYFPLFCCARTGTTASTFHLISSFTICHLIDSNISVPSCPVVGAVAGSFYSMIISFLSARFNGNRTNDTFQALKCHPSSFFERNHDHQHGSGVFPLVEVRGISSRRSTRLGQPGSDVPLARHSLPDRFDSPHTLLPNEKTPLDRVSFLWWR